MSSQSSLVRPPRIRALAPLVLTAAVVAAVTVVLVSATPRAAAVPVRGLVGLPRPDAAAATAPAAPARRDHYWNVWAELLDPAPARVAPEREVTVVLTGDGTPRARGCSYLIEGGELLPRTLVVQANSRVSLENRDGTAHEIFSETLTSLTPLRTAAGRAREIAVPDPGQWELRDRQYPQLVGHLVAVPDLVACAAVNPRGEWRFADVPAGTYVLKVYRAGEEAHAAPLTVAANAREVVVDPILLTGN